ncbi:TetR/AcrR family transcriptional regulator [Mucilaginibacter celer]|uniref:TetR family transcriptional regulator n=1 Tax=Mucilaginibacter celer TaxID=2305508 RepID=A0A494VSE6_9SPHI|nr:TetR/AcrR family transcriptional regulator [Mucilaginibacter celer]AYL94295.1 TetR family transcriptional regulator [Mucilaginibacter celer]
MKATAPISTKKRSPDSQVKQDGMRRKIFEATLNICLREGWEAVSMRRIAQVIDAAAPLIYQYFLNKEALRAELTKTGFRRLLFSMRSVPNPALPPERQYLAMWLAYWDFAKENQPLYQLMLGVALDTNSVESYPEEINPVLRLVSTFTGNQPADRYIDEDSIIRNAYAAWAFIHGLVTLRITRNPLTEKEYLLIITEHIGLISGTGVLTDNRDPATPAYQHIN